MASVMITSSPYSLPAFASPSMSFHNKTARSDMGSVIVVMNVRTNEKVGDQLNGSTGTRLSSGSYQFKYGLDMALFGRMVIGLASLPTFISDVLIHII